MVSIGEESNICNISGTTSESKTQFLGLHWSSLPYSEGWDLDYHTALATLQIWSCDPIPLICLSLKQLFSLLLHLTLTNVLNLESNIKTYSSRNYAHIKIRVYWNTLMYVFMCLLKNCTLNITFPYCFYRFFLESIHS